MNTLWQDLSAARTLLCRYCSEPWVVYYSLPARTLPIFNSLAPPRGESGSDGRTAVRM